MKETLKIDICDFDPSFKENFPHKSDEEILYKVEDEIPFIFSALHAIQILICQALSVVWLPVTLCTHLCILPPDPARTYLVSAAFFSSGVTTLAQSVIGIRLPSVVTPSVIYTTALVTLLESSSELQCPSSGDLYVMGPADRVVEWQVRLREVQGALLFAGSLQVFLALSGLQTWIHKIINPPVMASAVILTGLTTNYTKADAILTSWDSSLLMCILFILFALILKNVKAPLPSFSLNDGLKITLLPVFRMFPVLWSIVTVYLISSALARFNFPILQQEKENIDFEEAVVSSKALYFFLPCGDSPPRSVARRGLTVEGLSVVFGAVWGTGVGSNPSIAGLTHFTGITSRRCSILTAVILIIFSIFPHSVLHISNIPISVTSTINICLCIGLVCIGMNIFWKSCEATSSRDTTIFGFSLLLGLAIPQWINVTNTFRTVGFLSKGVNALNQCLRSQVFVGVIVGCLLNTVLPGRKTKHKPRDPKDRKLYQLPTWEELLCSVLDLSAFFSSE